MNENDPIERLNRHALIMAIWMPVGLLSAVLLGHGIGEGLAWWIASGFASILLGFAGHVIANAVLGSGFTSGETALCLVAFAAALIALLVTILVAPAALAETLVLPVGIGLASLVIAVIAYLVIRHGPRGAFAMFDVIRDNNRRSASHLPHRGGGRR